MIRLISSAIGLFAAMFVLQANAEHVYTYDSGRWHINGYTEPNIMDNACIISTSWPESGRRIKINYFTVSGNVTMTVTDPAWDLSNWPVNKKFNVKVQFYSDKYGWNEINTKAQVYTDNKVIFRGMGRQFMKAIKKYDSMWLFVGSTGEIHVNLEGTMDLMRDLKYCQEAVNPYTYEDEEYDHYIEENQ